MGRIILHVSYACNMQIALIAVLFINTIFKKLRAPVNLAVRVSSPLFRYKKLTLRGNDMP